MNKRFVLAATAIAAQVVFAVPQFRPMTMTVIRSGGAVVSFDLEFSQAAAATELYACCGDSDAGATTNGWDSVVKIADVAGDATSLSVPISTFPRWGRTNNKAIRFVMQPGELFDRATAYLASENFGGSNPPAAATQRIDTGYVLTAADSAEVVWQHTHPTSQGNTLILGTPRFDSNGNGAGGFVISYEPGIDGHGYRMRWVKLKRQACHGPGQGLQRQDQQACKDQGKRLFHHEHLTVRTLDQYIINALL